MDEKTTVAICDNTVSTVAPSIAVYPNEITATTGPMEISERPINKTSRLGFGAAIEAMKNGKRVAREGWNGKGMFLYYISADRYPAKTEIAKTIADDDGKVPYGAYVALKTVSGLVIPWTPNMLDMLAEDWVIVD